MTISKKALIIITILILASILSSCALQFLFEPVSGSYTTPLTPYTVIDTASPELLPDSSPIPSSPSVAQIEKILLWEQDGIEIYADSIVYGGYLGPELKISITNNSDKNIKVYVTDLNVNDYMLVVNNFRAEVLSNKKTVALLDLQEELLDEANIVSIAKIELKFEVDEVIERDGYIVIESNPTTLFTTETITIKTNYFDLVVQEKLDEGLVVYNQNDIRIVAKEFKLYTSYYSLLSFYIENNSASKIRITAKNVTIDDYMMNTYMSNYIIPGKMAIAHLRFTNSELEDAGITKVNKIEFILRIYSFDNDSSIETEIITLEF